MPLDFKYPFLFPFCAQTPSLFRFALRAVPLATVDAVIFMAVLAMRLLGIDVSHRRGISLRVFGRGHGVQMLVVDTRPIAASVVHDESIRNRFACQEHCHAMRLSAGAAKGNDSVSVFVGVPGPNHAIA